MIRRRGLPKAEARAVAILTGTGIEAPPRRTPRRRLL